MARPSSIPAICKNVDGEVLHPDQHTMCFEKEHIREPNPQWWITEDGFPFQKGDRVYNYYDGEWGTVENDPGEDDRFGWFDFRPEGSTFTKPLNSVRISSKEPSR